ncbi:MAG TPA: hypothetical protein PKA27_00865, partial [Fimbriimonadaceae bacterium]|nr:hypothetical protein [Fimbriimonadaceae bacterium]
ILDPPTVDAAIREIPRGKSVPIADLRRELATAYDADAACPISTGNFVRIAAEVALEQLAGGDSHDAVTPFWRVVDPGSPLAKKLSCGPDYLARLRQAEGI